MIRQPYTKEQAAESARFYNALKSVPLDKRDILTLMTEAFISGMEAQEQLTERAKLNT